MNGDLIYTCRESHEALACRGYTQADAARIGLNVLLYSLNQ